MDNNAFKAAIRAYCQSEGVTISQLAENLGKPRKTVSHWVNEGIKNDAVREAVIQQNPEIFRVIVPLREQNTKIAAAQDERQLLTIVKIEQARVSVLHLAGLLHWFLFVATADERNAFRDLLGEDWTKFLNLTRAMTNEKALEIARQEGVLD